MNKHRILPIAALFILASYGTALAIDKVLIFTRTVVTPTSGYREDNIAQARIALKRFLESKGLAVDTSESDTLFKDATLATYKTIIFLKTSGNILNEAEHTAFEKYFRNGGGFVGIHSALDTEFNWAFYGQIIGGGYYKSLGGDASTKDTIVVEDATDISTKFLPHRWGRTDEVYNFKSNPRSVSTVHVLLTVDESTYPKGVPGTDHPMTWKNELFGGRAWITAMGHPSANYLDSLFMNHLWGGIQYAMGRTTTSISAPMSSGSIHKRTSYASKSFIRLSHGTPLLFSAEQETPLSRDIFGRAFRAGPSSYI